MEPILQPHLGREPSQQSYPAALSQWHIPLNPCSNPEVLPHPNIDHIADSAAQGHNQQTQLETQPELMSEKLSLPKQTYEV